MQLGEMVWGFFCEKVEWVWWVLNKGLDKAEKATQYREYLTLAFPVTGSHSLGQ